MSYLNHRMSSFGSFSYLRSRIHCLKMLGLYLYTLTISHKSSNMLRILNKLTLYKELQTLETNNGFLDKKLKTQQQNKKIKHKNPCRIWGLHPGPLAPKADAIPLHHRVN